MNKLYKLLGAVVCVLSLPAFSNAQMTTITASSLNMGGLPVASGSVSLTPVDAHGKPIPFVQGGGGLNSAQPFVCRILNGAITGTCQVPDSALTTPAHISYSVQISSTPSQKAFVMNAVPNITGSTWALDEYAPVAMTINVQPIQVSYGTEAPSSSCVAPSFYVRNASGGLLYMCVGSSWVLVTGSGGGSASVTPESMSSAVFTLTGCSDPTKSWSPAANACVSNTGPQGPAGAKGDTGAQGPKGDTGATGPTGATGSTGLAGNSATMSVGTVTTGAAGSSAAVSNAGTSSAAVLNFTIPRGADGSKGDTGDTGPKGDTGATGSAGSAATIAVGTVTTGAAGTSAAVTNGGGSSAAVFNFKIPQGLKGDKGDTGDTGSQGPSGGSTNWRGTWDDASSYAIYDAIAYQGSSYIAVTANTNITPGTDNSKWQLLAQVGAQGPKGDKGDTGDAGAIGAAGIAATVTVGTVTPLSAGSTPTVTNAGTSSAAVLNFGLPTTGTRFWSCQPGFGDGLNTITTGSYIQWTCRNDTGSTVTLTGISCIADAGSSTVNMTNGSGTALLSAAISCGTTYTAGTQSATATLADGDFIKLTIAASGSKQVDVDVKGTL